MATRKTAAPPDVDDDVPPPTHTRPAGTAGPKVKPKATTTPAPAALPKRELTVVDVDVPTGYTYTIALALSDGRYIHAILQDQSPGRAGHDPNLREVVADALRCTIAR